MMFLKSWQLKLNESDGNTVTFNEDKPVSLLPFAKLFQYTKYLQIIWQTDWKTA